MAEGNGYLVAAYVVMWVGLIGYGLKLHRVFRDAERRLDEASREWEGRNA
jgi:CcmD family protein